MKKNCVLSWSGGKDSALALLYLQKSEKYSIKGLLTTVMEPVEEINLHHVPVDLIRAQAKSLGLPLYEVNVPHNADNKTYEYAHLEMLQKLKKEDISSLAFGDIFLDEIRKYREDMLKPTGIDVQFPLWHKDTKALANTFVSLGFKAIVVAVDQKKCGTGMAGRLLDKRFLNELPQNVDPCGEHGEFHSFVYDGPLFKRAIQYNKTAQRLIDYRPQADLEMLITEIKQI
jgi:uncharacterized protein (TIGR00290 family)